MHSTCLMVIKLRLIAMQAGSAVFEVGWAVKFMLVTPSSSLGNVPDYTSSAGATQQACVAIPDIPFELWQHHQSLHTHAPWILGSSMSAMSRSRHAAST